MTSHRRGFITRLSQARSSRHVEVQVVTDTVGDVWTLGVRPCGQRWILHPSI